MKNGILWILWFTLILCLSTVYLFGYDHWSLGLWGFPSWLFGFFLIEMLLVGSIALFVIRYWKSPGEES